MKRYAILSAMKTVFVLLVLALAVGFYGQPAQAIPLTPVINNGSFENTTGFVPDYRDSMELNGGSTTITGWLVTGRQVLWIGPTNPYGLTASNGSYFLDLTGDYAGSPYGGVEQTIVAVPGKYTLEFDLGSSTTYGLPDAITVAITGSSPQTFTSTNPSSSNAWELEAMPFTVTGIGPQYVTISLTGSGGYNYIGLDNVKVVPIPAAGWLLGSGLMGLGLLRFRRKA